MSRLWKIRAAPSVASVKAFDCISALRALGEESRLRILRLLLDRPRNVTELAETLELTTYNVSKHLRVLKQAGLVDCTKDGQQRFYGVAADLRQHLQHHENVLDLGCCLFRFDQLPQ